MRKMLFDGTMKKKILLIKVNKLCKIALTDTLEVLYLKDQEQKIEFQTLDRTVSPQIYHLLSCHPPLQPTVIPRSQ